MNKIPRDKTVQPYWMNLLVLGLLLAGWLPATEAAPRLPSAKRECSTCHIMWLTEFKRDDVQTLIPYDPTPTVESGKQDVVSTERMCFSCHDGFVLDSRFLWKNRKHTHPVGVIPSDKVKIPLVEGKEVFPLNQDGKMYCGTCHSAHGIDWNQKEATIFLRVNNHNSTMCILCHNNKAGGPFKNNHPILQQAMPSAKKLLVVGGELGSKNEVICQSCHRPHGSSEKKLLVKSNQNSALCATCHDDKKGIMGSKHDLGLMAPEAKNILGKTVAQSGPCSACHIPHENNGIRLWARYKDPDLDTVSAFCLGCHKDDGPAHKKTLGIQTHPVNVPVAKVGITARKGKWQSRFPAMKNLPAIKALPLFNAQGKPAKQAGNITCLTCHDPHVWDHKSVNAPLPDPRKLEGDGSNSFLRIAHDGKNLLCTNCHRDKAVVQLSKHNLEISARGEKNRDGKTVEQSGTCSACHLPHNGSGAKMWARALSRKWEGVEKLCVSCHIDNGVARDKLPGEFGHPVHVSLDKLPEKVNPGLPLFNWDAQHDQKHGEVDCGTCHDPHQWQPGKPLSTLGANAEVEGDANTSFLRIPATHGAKLCLKCHVDKKYLLGTDHDMRVTARKVKNAKGQKLAQSGVCGQCHSVHTPVMKQRLWARKPGQGKDPLERQCRSCHRKDGPAAKKVPPNLEHPPRTVPSNKGRLYGGRRNNILPPVFDTEGQPVMAGRITCPTCHNPHQWDPARKQPGKGKNLEGDVSTSFLRHSQTDYFLCTDCHGEDALFRYKYFHWDKSRVKHHLYKP